MDWMETPEGITLLFVDDDTSFIALAQQVLLKYQGNRFNIIWKQSGAQALKELSENSTVDLILIDYYLPEVNGLDVIREMRRQKVTLPIILLTSQRDFRLAVEALKYEVEDYIIKDDNIDFVLPRAIVNIHERIQLKKKIAEQQKADLIAKRRTEAIKELVVTVCHEFNNPLAAIKISADIIARQDLPSEARELVEELDRNIGAVEAEIARLRDINFEKLES